MEARILRSRSGREFDRDVHVTPETGPAKSDWSGEFWTPIADRYEPGEEVFVTLKDGRAGYGKVSRVELDVRISTNCRVEFIGTSPLG